jgi:hypothetical protein
MFSDSLKSSSVHKLESLLKDRYGLGMQVNFLVDSAKQETTTDSYYLVDSDLKVPVVAKGKWLATVVVPSAGRLEFKDHSAIADLVRLVLEPTLYSWYLEQFENNQKSAFVNSENNILDNISDEINTIDSFETPSEHGKMQIIGSVLRLKSSNTKQINKVALEIHEIADRWAFLRFNEIMAGIHDLNDLKSLGPVTLFIEDLSALPLNMLSLISNYSLDSSPDDHPLILIATRESKEKVSENIQSILVDVDRLPAEINQLRDTVTLLLDREATIN